MKKHLEIRKSVKSRKPNFVRGDSNKEKCKTSNKWRKPRGLHNKRRLNKKGHQKNPSVGFKSPKLVKNLNKDGLNIKLVTNINQLKKIKKDRDIVLISSTIGVKKKIVLLEICLKDGLKVSNFKDIKLFIDKSKNKLKEKKEISIKKSEKKKKDLEALKKKDEKNKDTKKENQDDVKKDILNSKQKEKIKIDDNSNKKDTTQSKGGHQASSVPGTKQ